MAIDFRAALNAISDVVENRPLALREFDQIYMKVGDLVLHAEFLARRFKDRKVVFIGDGDAVGIALMHLRQQGVLQYGPTSVHVLDFDERMVNSVNRFATDNQCDETLSAELYNVADALPAEHVGAYEAFHINPPWGQHNEGASVTGFLDRAICAVGVGGIGAVVIAHDPERSWAVDVLRRTQRHALQEGCVIDEMIPSLHSYHLDDAPDLRSCAIVVQKVAEQGKENRSMGTAELANFYGRGQPLRVQYVRDRTMVGRGSEGVENYRLEPIREEGRGA